MHLTLFQSSICVLAVALSVVGKGVPERTPYSPTPEAYSLFRKGMEVKARGDLREAAHLLTRAAAIDPYFAQAHNSLGVLLLSVGQAENALKSFRNALAVKDRYVLGAVNAAIACMKLQRRHEALHFAGMAVEWNSSNVEAVRIAAETSSFVQNYAQAVPFFERALRLVGEDDVLRRDILINMGVALLESQQEQRAIDVYSQVLSMSPGHPIATANLAIAKQLVCNWTDWEVSVSHISRVLEQELSHPGPIPSVKAFHAFVFPLSGDLTRRLVQRHAEPFAIEAKAASRPPCGRTLAPGERLRIGYISRDFRIHPTGYLVRNMFSFHNRQRFEIFVYSLGRDDGSAVHHSIASSAEHFVDLSSTPHVNVTRRIVSDCLHVLVELNGWLSTEMHDILAAQGAPLQISFLAYPGTTGAPYIQHLVADPVAAPPDLARLYTEGLLLLPRHYQVNDYMQSFLLDQTNDTHHAHGLPEDGFVFCNFNGLYKITPDIFAVWMRILHRVPGSVLWLLTRTQDAERNIKKEADKAGIDPSRVIIAPRVKKEEHLARAGLADLFLDTLVVNAHSTGADALWAGVPMITVAGERMAGRIGAALVTTAGASDLIVPSLKAYEELAVSLALNRTRYGEIRRRLENERRSSPLFDTRGFVATFESLLALTWETHHTGAIKGTPHVILAGEHQPKWESNTPITMKHA